MYFQILTEILHYIPARDLIRRCRSVSRLWNSVSNSISRRRHLKLKLSGRGKQNADLFKELSATFANCSDFPWSACYILCDAQTRKRWGGFPTMQDGSFRPQEVRKFAKQFGTNVWKLEIAGSDGAFPVECLEEMPNLEILLNTVDPAIPAQRVTRRREKLKEELILHPRKLTKLRRLETRINGQQSVDFLNTLINQYGAHLHQIEFTAFKNRYASRVDVDPVSVAVLLPNIPSLSLIEGICQQDSIVLETLASQDSGLKKFKLLFSPESLEYEFFQALERFLANNSQHLQHLDMECTKLVDTREGVLRSGQALPTCIKLPVLSELRSLRLYEFWVNDPFVCLSPFVTNQFPKLEKVILPNTSHRTLNTLFNSCRFDSVTEFNGYSHDGLGEWFNSTHVDWATVFPNLLILKFRVKVKELSYIFSRMCKLEHLSLEFGAYVEEEDVNAALSGLLMPDVICRKSAEEIREARFRSGSPSVVDLKSKQAKHDNV